MFDVSFWELVVIGIVALLVIGPKRLPEVARTVGTYVGKMRRFVAAVQRDLNTEINKATELNRLLEEQKRLVEKHEIFDELNRTVSVNGNKTDSNTSAAGAADNKDSSSDGQQKP